MCRMEESSIVMHIRQCYLNVEAKAPANVGNVGNVLHPGCGSGGASVDSPRGKIVRAPWGKAMSGVDYVMSSLNVTCMTALHGPGTLSLASLVCWAQALASVACKRRNVALLTSSPIPVEPEMYEATGGKARMPVGVGFSVGWRSGVVK